MINNHKKIKIKTAWRCPKITDEISVEKTGTWLKKGNLKTETD